MMISMKKMKRVSDLNSLYMLSCDAAAQAFLCTLQWLGETLETAQKGENQLVTRPKLGHFTHWHKAAPRAAPAGSRRD